MTTEAELFKEGKYEELWERCCGFIDLSLEDFISIQRRLLLEQLELLKRCELGKVVMRGATPRTLEEFREQVPLTTYDDYAPYLLKRRMDVLPKKYWIGYNERLVSFGQQVCKPISPHCSDCPLERDCPQVDVEIHR